LSRIASPARRQFYQRPRSFPANKKPRDFSRGLGFFASPRTPLWPSPRAIEAHVIRALDGGGGQGKDGQPRTAAGLPVFGCRLRHLRVS
jgi:hypothetical protein